MDEQVPTFLAVTGTEDADVAKQYLELTGGDLEYAVTLFMESQPPSTANPHADDELYAQRLQQEAYGAQEEPRAADTAIHRHETLVDGFGGGGFNLPDMISDRPTDIFGAGRTGIFNQRFDEEENDYYTQRSLEEDNPYEEDEDEIIVLDSDEEEPVRTSRRRQNRQNRDEELTSNQRRLLNLFRPPFDIMSKISLDNAKKQGREEKKWILINIQDASEFQCQVLNRDFWSNSRVKQVVNDEFIFMQYQNDSPNGVNYLNFYSTSAFPHIAILDPLTGERVRTWTDGEVPQASEWVLEVEQFLTEFSLNPDSNNPVVRHEVKFDPDALTEEQQIEFALKQSIRDNEGNSEENAIALDEQLVDTDPKELVEPKDPFDLLVPTDHIEPTDGATTRIQVRFPNGKRSIHKFALSDQVRTIFQWLKFTLSQQPEEFGLSSDERFTLSNNAHKSLKLIESLDLTVDEANLKNASLLLEKA
ncbi:uncharacterized protein CANTADRAFT_23633 [Suhomyces tanzawaensis NRRL Y-17324]|uniref:UBX domain-containing protein n=1 Tax=Suhomyces tanzawaensis NRRL Y-17324 TaxID=984487 RepID=A0A1E4SDD4_9ASCO|nr:uncharacterized protein CANTADRAFT_23633 [Suhomyces tanzawaensis NRRL Y-17324]ODV77515.1 hypothetical protein CANTADRAFT_23633 [Suhomyces tanzawaensis NRRL Y-17324]